MRLEPLALTDVPDKTLIGKLVNAPVIIAKRQQVETHAVTLDFTSCSSNHMLSHTGKFKTTYFYCIAKSLLHFSPQQCYCTTRQRFYFT